MPDTVTGQVQLRSLDIVPGDQNWDELKTVVHTLENINFFGGDPFSSEPIADFLEYAVDVGCADKISLHFDTSGNMFPHQLIPTILKFKFVNVSVSINNTGRRFELEQGESWDHIVSNAEKFKQLQSINFAVKIKTMVNIQNVYYLDAVLEWAKIIGLPVTLHVAERPQWNSIDHMTNAAKKLIINKYSVSKNAHLKNIARRVANSDGSDGAIFVKRMRQIDQTRSEDFSESQPEIARAMGY